MVLCAAAYVFNMLFVVYIVAACFAPFLLMYSTVVREVRSSNFEVRGAICCCLCLQYVVLSCTTIVQFMEVIGSSSMFVVLSATA